MADMYGNYIGTDIPQEQDVFNDLNKISVSFAGLAFENEFFKDKMDAAHFGATSALYLVRTFSPEILKDIRRSYSVFRMAFGLCLNIYDSAEMSDEKALVDKMIAEGHLHMMDSEKMEEENPDIVGEDF